MNLYFKFRPDVKPPARARTLRLLRGMGVRKVALLFPRTTRPELKSHYVVEVPDAAAAKRLRLLLRSTNEVIYAEPEVRRGPM